MSDSHDVCVLVLTTMARFPHTRAQLLHLAKQLKPLPSDVYDLDADDDPRVTSEFVDQVVTLLRAEQEDELKDLLKQSYGIDDDMVRTLSCPRLR